MSELPIQHSFPRTQQHLSDAQWRNWMLYHNFKRTALVSERKLIAWLQTSLSLVALGFVVARIELFLRGTSRGGGQAAPAFPSHTAWVPPLFFALAVLVAVFGTLDFFRDRRRLRLGDMARSNLLDVLIFATLLVVVTSVILFLLPVV